MSRYLPQTRRHAPRASQPASGSQRTRGTQEGKKSLTEDDQQLVDAPHQGPATRRSQKKWGELPPGGATGAKFCKAFGFTMRDVPSRTRTHACPRTRTHALSPALSPRSSVVLTRSRPSSSSPPPAPLSIDYIMQHHNQETSDKPNLCLGHNRLVTFYEYGESTTSALVRHLKEKRSHL